MSWSRHMVSPPHCSKPDMYLEIPHTDMVASLTGHTHRVLYLAMSPDGETIVTGAGMRP